MLINKISPLSITFFILCLVILNFVPATPEHLLLRDKRFVVYPYGGTFKVITLLFRTKHSYSKSVSVIPIISYYSAGNRHWDSSEVRFETVDGRWMEFSISIC